MPSPDRFTQKRAETHCIGGWVDPWASLTGAENLAPPGCDPHYFRCPSQKKKANAIKMTAHLHLSPEITRL
jgi:hypothetical protein